jgi:K+-transporting ATPase ATPase C chain
MRNGSPVGSSLIGQPFDDPKYFWGRPSATQPFPYNAAASSGSNLGQSNPALLPRVQARIASLRAADPDDQKPIPVDLVTASGSGLDPHISPAAAEYQVQRVAKARQLDEARVRDLIAACTEGRQFGILGEPRISVLRLNLALDDLR